MDMHRLATPHAQDMISRGQIRRSTGQLVAQAVQRIIPSQLADSTALAKSKLSQALKYEVAKGMRNAKGNTMIFSEFATSQLQELISHSTTNEEKVKYSACLKGFSKYESMRPEQRQEQVSKANWLAEGRQMYFPRLPTASEDAQKDRLESNSRTSTTERRLGTTKNSQGSHRQPAAERTERVRPFYMTFSDPDFDSETSRFNGGKAQERLPAEGVHSTELAAEVPLEKDEMQKNMQIEDQAEVTGNEIRAPSEVISEGHLLQDQIDAGSQAHDVKTAGTEEVQKLVLRASFEDAAADFPRRMAEMHQTRRTGPQAEEQRTQAWFAMRENRLTASTFGNAAGFWKVEGRVKLWEEKIGIGEKFAGNEATVWGTRQEPVAAARYQEITGHAVESMSFKLYGDSLVTSWLGASPDGLIPATNFDTAGTRGRRMEGPYGRAPQGPGPGVLEIKCPFSKPNPYPQAPWYYMAQAQGLMEIFDREWLNLYAHTPRASATYHIPRDRAYWKDLFAVLSDFWWTDVVPAKHCLFRELDFEEHRPEEHALTSQLIERSKHMAEHAVTRFYPPKYGVI